MKMIKFREVSTWFSNAFEVLDQVENLRDLLELYYHRHHLQPIVSLVQINRSDYTMLMNG